MSIFGFSISSAQLIGKMYPRIECRVRLISELILAVLLASGNPAIAADPPEADKGRTIMRGTVLALQNRLSVDTTPIDLTYFGIHYRIPRNYIVYLSNWNGPAQEFIGLQVNIPDLKPFEPATAACFLARTIDRPPGCQPLELSIQGVRGFDADQVFQNVQRFFHNQVAIRDPSGMELYESGPDIARRNLYRTDTPDGHFLYSCLLSFGDLAHAVCSVEADKTKNGSYLHYFFPSKYLTGIRQIDEDIRHLVDSFVVTQKGAP